MSQPRVLILRAPGTNCDQETAFAFELAGATTDVLHVNRLLETPGIVDDYQILCLPGGFSYGDDLAAGRILANQVRHHLAETLHEFRRRDKLILGICNGFQVLIQSGLLVEDDADGQVPATLTRNERGYFEDRWVDLRVASPQCVFLRGLDRLYLPIAHAEGRFVCRSQAVRESLEQQGRLVLKYDVPPEAESASFATSESMQQRGTAGASSRTSVAGATNVRTAGGPSVPYPANPNGSDHDVAGICDATGRVFGLMPHPERHVDPTHHPRWTRRVNNPDDLAGEGEGEARARPGNIPQRHRVFPGVSRVFPGLSGAQRGRSQHVGDETTPLERCNFRQRVTQRVRNNAPPREPEIRA